MEGIGSPSGSATQIDLSGGSYALVAKDYAAAGGNVGIGFDGIEVGDLHVALNNFVLSDLIYIDDQSNNAAALNNLTQTAVISDTGKTVIQFAGNNGGLGGLINITVPSNIGYDSIANLSNAVGSTAVISA
jgi:hypothetical protein